MSRRDFSSLECEHPVSRNFLVVLADLPKFRLSKNLAFPMSDELKVWAKAAPTAWAEFVEIRERANQQGHRAAPLTSSPPQ